MKLKNIIIALLAAATAEQNRGRNHPQKKCGATSCRATSKKTSQKLNLIKNDASLKSVWLN